MQNEQNSITIGDLLRVAKKNIILMAIITFVTVLLGAVYTFKIVDPTYRATTTVVVGVPTGTSTEKADSTDSLRGVVTITSLVNQECVLEIAANELGCKMEDLSVSAKNPNQTLLVVITAIDKVPAKAVKEANAVAKALCEYADVDTCSSYSGKDVMKINNFQLNITNTATEAKYNSPNKTLYMLLFIVVGVVASCAVVFVKEFMSNKFKTEDDVKASVNKDVIGVLLDDKEKKKAEKITLVTPSLQAFEPFNKILSNVKYSNIDNPNRVIMVTSSVMGELKSTTATNLAYCMANNNHKVVLIDLDTRKPVDHKAFGVSRAIGLVEYLDGSASKADIIKKTNQGVDLITAGKKVLNPVVIIESAGLKKLIEELKEEYEYIVIDTPPVMACSDALLVSKLVDGVVFNVSINQVKKKDTKSAIAALEGVGANIIGVNLTKMPYTKRESHYYYYYHSYGDNPTPDVVDVKAPEEVKENNDKE